MMQTTRARPAVLAAQRLYATAVPASEAFPGVRSVAGGPDSLGEVQTTQLSNGVVIASQDNGGAASAITVAVGAGSRNETYTTAGVTHYLRNLAFQGTKTKTLIKITRESELRGARLSATSGRDHIAYNAQFLRDDIEFTGSLVAETVANPTIADWLVGKQNERVALDLANMQGSATMTLLDDVHRTAFRGSPLGRGLIIPATRVGSVSASMLQDFHSQFFTGPNTVVTGVDVDHQALVEAVSAQLQQLQSTTVEQTSSQYFGGESVTATDDSVTNVVLAFKAQGVAVDQAAQLVLRNLLGGNGSALKWATDASASAVGKAVAQAVTGPFQASAFGSIYSDIGLIGVHVAVGNAEVKPAVSAAAEGIKSVLAGKFSEEDLKAAKAQLKAQILLDGSSDRALDMAGQLLSSNTLVTPEAAAAKVDAVTMDAVKKVATEMKGVRPVLVARGQVDNLPYLDALGF